MNQIRYVTFGTTNLVVSQLCFGALPMGPLQKGLSPQVGGEVITYALKQGVNFIDTAELYGTYEHIRLALKQISTPPVIATKSGSCTYEDMRKSVENARRKLDLDVIPIFHLHAARAGVGVFDERAGAIKCLLEYKEKGIISAIGIATHHCQVVTKAATNPDIDVVFALINRAGLGILGGSKEDMQQAMDYACSNNKGVYAMKAFAGGNLLHERETALKWVLATPGLEVVAIGMINTTEVDINLHMISQQPIPDHLLAYGIADKQLNVVPSLCKGCGTCTHTCPNEALSMQEDMAQIDRNKCILCGYCSAACPEFAIRMV